MCETSVASSRACPAGRIPTAIDIVLGIGPVHVIRSALTHLYFNEAEHWMRFTYYHSVEGEARLVDKTELGPVSGRRVRDDNDGHISNGGFELGDGSVCACI
jgi:hypothetical protein